MSLSRHIRLFRPLAVLLALSVAVFSCKEPVKVEPVVPPVLTVKTQTVEGEAGSQFITISATGDWTISTSASWLSVNPSSGSGNNNMVVLSYSENRSRRIYLCQPDPEQTDRSRASGTR